jgi:hypothetical protein
LPKNGSQKNKSQAKKKTKKIQFFEKINLTKNGSPKKDKKNKIGQKKLGKAKQKNKSPKKCLAKK